MDLSQIGGLSLIASLALALTVFRRVPTVVIPTVLGAALYVAKHMAADPAWFMSFGHDLANATGVGPAVDAFPRELAQALHDMLLPVQDAIQRGWATLPPPAAPHVPLEEAIRNFATAASQVRMAP